MTYSEHTCKAMASAAVLGPEIITETVRANDRAGSLRLEHLFEAYRLALELASDIQTAITAEQMRCGAAAVPAIAARLRVVAQQKPKE